MFSLSTVKIAAPCSSFGRVQYNCNDWSRLESTSRSVQQLTQHYAATRKQKKSDHSDRLLWSLGIPLRYLAVSIMDRSWHVILMDCCWRTCVPDRSCLASSWSLSSRGATTKIAHLFAKTCKFCLLLHQHHHFTWVMNSYDFKHALFDEYTVPTCPNIQRRWKASEDQALDRPKAGRKPHYISQLCSRSVWKQDSNGI